MIDFVTDNKMSIVVPEAIIRQFGCTSMPISCMIVILRKQECAGQRLEILML